MDKEILRNVIFDQHEIIRNFHIVPRTIKLEMNVNYVLTGLRRAGKTVLLYKIVQDLIASGVTWKEIIYVNFGMKDWKVSPSLILMILSLCKLSLAGKGISSSMEFRILMDGKSLQEVWEMQSSMYALLEAMRRCLAVISQKDLVDGIYQLMCLLTLFQSTLRHYQFLMIVLHYHRHEDVQRY